MGYLTIGQLSNRLNVTSVTIRYYERRGLMMPTCYSENGYRLYAESAVSRFRFIVNAKLAGFKLNEIQEILTLLDNKTLTSHEVRTKTLEKIEAIKNKIKKLKSIQISLEHLVSICDGKVPIEECPIMKEFFGGSKVVMAE